jgi:hypothetical protein
MNKLKIYPAILMTILFFSTSSHAQFLKSILNKIKNKGSNNADSSAQNNANSTASSYDSARINKMLSAYGKNPHDTSAVMANLFGSMPGGPSVSPADSAAALKSFESASGGSGELYQYSSTTTTKKGDITDTTSECISHSGEFRSVVRMNTPQMAFDMIMIGHSYKPKYSIALYPEDKTYSLNILDTSMVKHSGGHSTYQVTKIGTETVRGYSCTHSRLVTTNGTSSTIMDIWTSIDVPGYSALKKMISVGNVQPDMIQALQEAGCEGFFVKMTSGQAEYSMTIQLVKVQQQDFAADLFEIPDGYTESNQGMMYHIMMAAMKNNPKTK